MCFLSTTFPNAPAHPPPPYFLTSPLLVFNKASKRHNKSNSFQYKLEQTFIKRWGGGGLIIGCIFLFTSGWAYNWGRVGANKRAFTDGMR